MPSTERPSHPIHSMPDDFDIDSLAAYLHLLPAQVTRLVDRGKLPGRRVQGAWRFSQADIHHWLEERIGVADDDLVDVEAIVERSAQQTGDDPLRIADLLSPTAIAPVLAARTSGKVITSMTDLAAETGFLWDPEKMAEALRRREELHPTALDNGVALLHPRRPMPNILAESFVALGRTASGVPFGGSQGGLTDLFFLVCSTDDRVHLRILSRLSRLLQSDALLEEIRAAGDSQGMFEAIRAAEDAADG